MQLSIGVASPGVHNRRPETHFYKLFFWDLTRFVLTPIIDFFLVAQFVPVGEVVGMAVDRVGCGGKSDGEVEDGSPNFNIDQKLSIIIIFQTVFMASGY